MTNSFNLNRLAYSLRYMKFELGDGVKANKGELGDLLAEVK